MKIAVYDFCDTIVGFQTADEYVRFTQQYLNLTSFMHTFMKYNLVRRVLGKSKHKRKMATLYQLRGLERSELEGAAKAYYKEKIIPQLHKPVIDTIEKNVREGYKIVLVSGGYSIYLKCFAQEHHVDAIVSNDFQYAKDRFTGKLIREDCMGEEKIDRMEEFLKTSMDEEDQLEHTICYSDSRSDIPILKWADKGIVISKEKHRDWAKEQGFEEMVMAEMCEL